MKNYLITGGAGFIGSQFIKTLQNTDKEIHIVNLDKFTYAGSKHNMKDHKKKNYDFIEGDICDKELLNTLNDKYSFNAIINFAAESHVDRSIESSHEFIRTNIYGITNLLDLSVNINEKQYCRFLQVSTDEVYGSRRYGSFNENSLLSPSNPYAASKASGDLIAMSYLKTYGIPLIITRSSNNFGPRQHNEKFIPMVITRILKNEDVSIYGEGLNIREWIYVSDNCRAILLALLKGINGEIYNIAGDDEISNLKMVEMIKDSLERKLNKRICPKIVHIDDRLGHDYRYSICSDKIVRMGYEKKVSLIKGINRTVDYYMKFLKEV